MFARFFAIYSGEGKMIRNLLTGIGILFSGFLGYVVFQVSGLCVSCESALLQYVLGFVLIALYISAFRSGVVNGEGRRKYIM